MAKNMTRKGLAAASTFALAVAGLVGIATPAAANTMVLEPTVGESNRVPVSETFELTTYHAAQDNIYNENLKVLVSDPDEGLVSTAGTNASTGVKLESTNSTFRSADNSFLVEGDGSGAPQTITLTPDTAKDDTFSVIVTTFIDAPSGSGNNDTPDTGEIQQSYEVFFHNEDDYTWNLDFTAPVFGDDELVASVSTSPELNLAQFEENIEMGFATIDPAGALSDITTDTTVGGTGTVDFTAGTSGNDGSDAELSSDGSSIEFKVAHTSTVGAATHAAGLLFDPIGGTKAEVARKLSVVGAATYDLISIPNLVAGPDASPAGILGDDSGEIREGSTVTIEADVTNGGDAVGDGLEVAVSIAATSMASDSTLAAGGETLEGDATDPIEFVSTTDEDGTVSIQVNTAGMEANETFTVTLSGQAAQPKNELFTVKATAPADLVEHNLLGTDAEWKVEDGTYTIRFSALDNFDQPLSGDYRVVLTPIIDDSGATPVTEEQQASSLAGGVATFSVNTTTADDDEVIRFEAQLQEASGAGFIDRLSVTNLTVNLGASNPATEISVTGTVGGPFDSDGVGPNYDLSASAPVGIDLSAVEFASANERLGEAFTESLPTPEILSGSLTDASGLNTYGSVTFTGEGLLFKVPATDQLLDVYSVGSITVQTGTDGDFAGVEVYSNQSGEQTVTVSSGSVSQDIVLEFDAPASDAGTTLVIDAPSAVEPGSTLVFDATLTDDFGNLVGGTTAATFNYDGPGFVVSEPTQFDAGEARMTIFLGNNDDGKTGTLTVTVADGVNDADDDLVVQKTVNIGDAPLAAGEFNAWTKLIDNDTAVKFYAKNPSDQGKIQFFFNGEEIAWHRGTSPTSYEGGEPRYNEDQDAYYLVRDVELVSGMKNVFEIEQDGERIWRAVKTLD